MNPISGGGRAKSLIEGSENVFCYTGKVQEQASSFIDAMKQHNPDVEVKVIYTEYAGLLAYLRASVLLTCSQGTPSSWPSSTPRKDGLWSVLGAMAAHVS